MIENRYEFTFFVQCRNCNPNGDPDLGNYPRQDMETGKGLISDVAIKRRIRNYIEAAFAGCDGMEILMRSGSNLNRSIAKAVVKAKSESEGSATITDKAAKLMCEKYFDVRTFGAVLSTGLNAGQVQGPVQFTFGESVDPIEISDITITRMCYTEGKSEDDNEYDKIDEKTPSDKKRTMGKKAIINYGLYRFNGFISANLAAKTGFSEEDLQYFFEALAQAYSEASSSKAGMELVGPIIIFKHVGHKSGNEEQDKREKLLGCAASYKLFNLLKCKKKDAVEFPRDVSDYEISLSISKCPDGVEVGLKDGSLSDIEWNPANNDLIKIC